MHKKQQVLDQIEAPKLFHLYRRSACLSMITDKARSTVMTLPKSSMSKSIILQKF